MNQDTRNKFTFYSFLFTFVIIGFHADFSNSYSQEAIKNTIASFWDYLANTAMSFFFMRTAFLLYYKADKKNAMDKIRRRIISLVVPFLLWNLIYFVIDYIRNRKMASLTEVILGFSFFPYDGPLWYMFAIILLLIPFPGIIWAKGKKWLLPLLIFMGLMFVFVYSDNALEKMFSVSDVSWQKKGISWLNRLCRYMPSYLLGMIGGMYFPERLDIRIGVKRKWACYLVFIVTALSWTLMRSVLPAGVKQIILLIMPVIVWQMYPAINDSLLLIVKNTFFLYATHDLFLSIIRGIIQKSKIMEMIANPFLKDSVCFILPILCCVIIYFSVLAIVGMLKKTHLDFVAKLLSGDRAS